ncbi:CAP10 domain-containing protein [Favolaschia claudopus]|uniref:CAP10 domain-containing protein n=1 Tax=Favolaschia claudopus TaxID=2862362 RepID=A0AAV9Z8H1_9AGAR
MSIPTHTRPARSQSTTDGLWSQCASRRLRFYLPCTGVLGVVGLLFMASSISLPKVPTFAPPDPPEHEEPLLPPEIAHKRIDDLYARQSQTLDQAAGRYTLKNGRAPPLNFEKWFGFALENRCLVDEYDQIQRDFEPFNRLAEAHPTNFQRMIDLGRELMLEDPKGMATIKIQDGEVQMPDYTGSAFDGEWKDTISRFSHILPDMDVLMNGRDEPRVVFNGRDPAMLKNAINLTDPKPFHLTPVPTSDFFRNRSGCSTIDTGKGFSINALEDVAFIRSASSSDFTTDFWPILSMTKISPCFSDILFPGQYYYYSSGWSGKFDRPSEVAWDDKKPQLYWRGTSNGGHIYGDNHHKFSRFRLVKIAQNNPDIIDAKMNAFWEWHCTDDCDRDPIIEEYDIGGDGRPREEVYQYKYLLDVDGNTFSGRYLGLLRSGSLVFKATAFEEYFDDWLRPYEHYIPVKIDMSDLVEKVEWAIANDAEARQIQENGMQFAQRVITDAQNDCYFAAVLLEWARVQGYARTLNR